MLRVFVLLTINYNRPLQTVFVLLPPCCLHHMTRSWRILHLARHSMDDCPKVVILVGYQGLSIHWMEPNWMLDVRTYAVNIRRWVLNPWLGREQLFGGPWDRWYLDCPPIEFHPGAGGFFHKPLGVNDGRKWLVSYEFDLCDVGRKFQEV